MREDVSRSPGGEGLDSSSEPLHLSPLSAGQLASRLALCERLGVGEGERQAHLLQRFQEVPGLYSALRAIRPELREGDLTPLIDVVLRAELPEDLLTALERSQAVCFSRGSFAFVWEALREHWSDTDFLADLNAHVDSLGDLYALLGEYQLRKSFPIEQARSAAVVVSSSSAVEHDLRHLLSLGPENRCRDPIHLRRHYREYSHLLPSRYVVEDNSLQEVARAISRREGGFDPKMGEMFIRGIARLPTRLKAPVEKVASRRELSSAALSLLKALLPRLQQLNSGPDQREVATALWRFSRDLPEQAQLGLRLCHALFDGQESARRDFFSRFQEGDYEGLEREVYTARLLAEREHFSERPVEELVQELEEYRSEGRDVPPSHIVEGSAAAVVAIRERGASLHLLPDEALIAHLRELRSTAEERAAADLMAFRIELLAGLSELVRRQYQILPNASQLLTIVMSDEMAEEFGSDAVRG
ncbi:hypothetical protein MRY87_06635, partial [bacterium]|nr:hypothetical protein [bacterium]